MGEGVWPKENNSKLTKALKNNNKIVSFLNFAQTLEYTHEIGVYIYVRHLRNMGC